MDRPIRLMLVDDHGVIRAGLRSYLERQEGLQVVAEAESGESAIAQAQIVRPDVVVMDISMPGMDGLQATRRLKEICPECNVLALTVHEDKQYFFEMLASGATGYLTKGAAADELLAAIRTVAEGQVYLQPTLARWLLEDYLRLSFQTSPGEREVAEVEIPHKLSPRERQVLELVAQGNTNSEISDMLGISPKTVARHRERIMAKLQIHSSAELVKFAIRTGIIEL